MRNIDARLLQAFERATGLKSKSLTGPEVGAVQFPMIVRLSKEDWPRIAIPGCRKVCKSGYVFACTGTLETLQYLSRDPDVLSVEASRSTSGSMIECATSVPFVKASKVHSPPVDETGERAIVAILDAGIDPLHAAFQDESGHTRFIGIWDQRDGAGPSPAGFDFGTEFVSSDINEFIAAKAVPAKYKISEIDAGSKHGTHVASIAGGRAVGDFAGGVAPAAKLIAVITDTFFAGRSDEPNSLGYSVTHFAGLEYIDSVRRRSMPETASRSECQPRHECRRPRWNDFP